MSEDLTPRQQILLWDLISRGGSALQKDLKPEVKPADREPLVRAKMISYDPKQRPYRLAIEKDGWYYLSAFAPTLSTSGIGAAFDRPILQFVLTKLHEYAAGEGLSYYELFADKPATIDDQKAHDAIPEPKQHPPAIEAAIRLAFFEIAGRPARDGVRLRKLRERLHDIERSDLDAALLRMRKIGTANLTNLDNPRDIAAEGDAALIVGDQSFHLLWIDS